jgi:hypothetical protein
MARTPKTKTVLTRKGFQPRKNKKFAKSLTFELDFLCKLPGYEIRGIRVRITSLNNTTFSQRTILSVGLTYHLEQRSFTVVEATQRTITINTRVGQEKKLSWWDFVWEYRHILNEYSEETATRRRADQAQREEARRQAMADMARFRTAQSAAKRPYKPGLTQARIVELQNKIAKIRPLADRPGTTGEGTAAKEMISKFEAELYA